MHDVYINSIRNKEYDVYAICVYMCVFSGASSV